MNIVYISKSRIPSREANSVHVMKMCSALAHKGHQVVLLCRKGEAEVDDHSCYGVADSFQIRKLAWPGLNRSGFLFSFLVGMFLRKMPKGTMIYGREIYGMSSAISMGFKCVFEVHSPPRSFLRKKMQERLFRKSNFVRLVSITQSLKNEYLRLFPVLSESNVIVAADGADIPESQGQHGSYTDIIGVKSERTQVGYVGSLYAGRGIDVILKLAAIMSDIDFHIVGGKEEDIQFWKNQAQSENVRIHGFVPNRDLCRYYQSFDLVLAPYQRRISLSGGKGDSARWTSPLKIFEYMAYEKPMIVSNLPVIKEVLEDGVNAILCEPDDIGCWRKSILRLRDDRALRVKMVDRAFQILKERYTWDKRVDLILRDIVKGK